MKTAHVTIAVYDMACGEARILEEVLVRTPGVIRAYVNPATEMAYVEYDAEAISPHELVAVMNRGGFRAGEPLVR